MKRNLFAISTLTLSIVALVSVLISSCSKNNNNLNTNNCTPAGTTVKIGSSLAGKFAVSVNATSDTTKDVILFDNVNRNFSGNTTLRDTTLRDTTLRDTTAHVGPASIVNVGPKTCLTYSDSVNAIFSTVPYYTNEGYVIKFADGHIAEFIAGSYISSGLISITYILKK